MTLIKYSFDNLWGSSIFYTIHFEIQLKVWYKLDRFGASRLIIYEFCFKHFYVKDSLCQQVFFIVIFGEDSRVNSLKVL